MSTSQTSTQNGAVKGDKAARRQRFEDVFPVIAKELSDHLKGEGMPKDAVEWYERVRRGVVRGGLLLMVELGLQHPGRCAVCHYVECR